MEMTGYWWPTVAAQYKGAAPGAQGMAKPRATAAAFIATGSATTDGQIVIGHESFTEFWNGQYMNIILDITPDKGNRMVMQTVPVGSRSMTDFWVTGGGMVVVETTMVGFRATTSPRCRSTCARAMPRQYATSIDEWVKLMDAKNNGGYANSWLIGDIKTNEIAKYEQGLIYQNLQKKTDGWYFGDNAPDDPRIRNLETRITATTTCASRPGARRMRWPQLLSQYEGRSTPRSARKCSATTLMSIWGDIEPSSRTISAHYDADPMSYVSDPNAVWNVPLLSCRLGGRQSDHGGRGQAR